MARDRHREVGAEESDATLQALMEQVMGFSSDPIALRATLFWVGLPIATRSEDPVRALLVDFGEEVEGPMDVVNGLRRSITERHPFKEASIRTITEVAGNEDGLFIVDDWKVWRQFDGPDFCNLAYRFYSNISIELFVVALPSLGRELIETMGREMAVITRAFSARWFNACARFETPSVNNVRWYLGHCLGKLELELARERSDWVEPARKRRNEIPHPTLDL